MTAGKPYHGRGKRRRLRKKTECRKDTGVRLLKRDDVTDEDNDREDKVKLIKEKDPELLMINPLVSDGNINLLLKNFVPDTVFCSQTARHKLYFTNGTSQTVLHKPYFTNGTSQTVPYKLYLTNCTSQTVPYKLYLTNCTLQTVPYKLYLTNRPYKLYLKTVPHKLYLTNCTLQTVPHKLYLTNCTSQISLHKLYLTNGTSQTARHKRHVTLRTLYFARPLFFVCPPDMDGPDRQRFSEKELNEIGLL